MAETGVSEFREYIPYAVAALGILGCFLPAFHVSISGAFAREFVSTEPNSAAIAGASRQFSVFEFLFPKTHAFILKTTALNSPLKMLVNIPKYLLSGFSALLVGSVALLLGAPYAAKDTYYGFGAMFSGFLFVMYGMHFAASVDLAYRPGFWLLVAAIVLSYLHSRNYV